MEAIAREAVSFDEARAEEFAGRMLQTLNDGCLSLLVSVGHQVGLFETLVETGPVTSDALAGRAGLQERYVRELLGGLTVGGIIEFDPESVTYSIPQEHAAFLTAEAGPDNFAMLMQYVPLMAEVEQELISCFRNGGGVPYSSFERFQTVQGEESRLKYDALLLSKMLPLDREVITSLERGIAVADFGCGEGYATVLMAERFPNSRFTGYDFSAEAIETARRTAADRGVTNITFEIADVATLALEGQHGLITAFDSIHDQADPAAVLRNANAGLSEDGVFLMVDIQASSNLEENLDHPLGAALYTFSTMHCMTVSLAQGGAGLGTCWGEQTARQMLEEAGFSRVNLRRVEGDFFHNFYFCR